MLTVTCCRRRLTGVTADRAVKILQSMTLADCPRDLAVLFVPGGTRRVAKYLTARAASIRFTSGSHGCQGSAASSGNSLRWNHQAQRLFRRRMEIIRQGTITFAEHREAWFPRHGKAKTFAWWLTAMTPERAMFFHIKIDDSKEAAWQYEHRYIDSTGRSSAHESGADCQSRR